VSPGTYSISAGVSGQTTAVYYSTNHKIPANSLTRIRPHWLACSKSATFYVMVCLLYETQ